MSRSIAALILALSTLAVLLVSGHATPMASAGRRLKQLTLFYDTPGASGSTSLDLSANAGVRPDGTFHAAGGASIASADAVSNPLLQALTGGAFDNRPEAATTTYTQIPLLLQQTILPTLSYGLAEARGDLFSASNGLWGNAEFGYNPVSNNLGASTSSGSTNSLNVGSSEQTGNVDEDSGFSGVEFAGFSNDLTNLADSRSDQSGQAISYPYNIGSPFNPLTCTQALLYAVTLTGYDLGTPVVPLPREPPPSVVPYCLTFFNFGTLDDFANFVDDVAADEERFFDANRDGIVEGLAALLPGGRLFNTDGNAVPGSAATDTTTEASIEAPPVSSETDNRATDGARGGNRPRADGPEDNAAALRALGRSGSRERSGRTSTRDPLPTGASADRLKALAGRSGDMDGPAGPAGRPPRAPPADFEESLARSIASGSPELQAFARSDLGMALLGRLAAGPIGTAADGVIQLGAEVSRRAADNLSGPLANLTAAVSNMTGAALINATDLGLRAAVAGLEAVEPLVRLGMTAHERIIAPLAAKSRETASRLAERSDDMLAQTVEALPEGEAKQEVQDALRSGGRGRQQRGDSSDSGRRGDTPSQGGNRRLLA